MLCSVGVQVRPQRMPKKFEIIITQCSSIAPDKQGDSMNEKAAEIRKLVGEIEDLAYWAHDYAGEIEDAEEREKMAETSEYLHVLKALIKLCPDDTLNKLHL